MKAAAYALAAVLFWLGAQGLVQLVEDNTEARLAQAEAYREGCLPQPGETAWIVSNGHTAHCRIYSSPSLHRGMAPHLISAAAVDVQTTYHPHKVRLAPVRAGIPFLGYVVWPQHLSAGQYLRRRYHHRLRDHERHGRDRSQALRSYRAALAHTGSTRHPVTHSGDRP